MLGDGRAGWYSYDWIDNDGQPDRGIPERQQLQVGDQILLRPGMGPWVRELQPNRPFVAGDHEAGTWCLALSPTEGGCRLVSRCRVDWPLTPATALWILLSDPGAFIMEHKMLKGIRSRPEAMVRYGRGACCRTSVRAGVASTVQGCVSHQGGASMQDAHHEVVDDTECRKLLAGRHLGRLAILDWDGPMIFPVNYVFDQDLVIFRTDPGTKLDAATEGGSVAFEVDAADAGTQTGWSVVVRGTLAEVTDPAHLKRLHALPLYPWAPGDKARYVCVVPHMITGRRIRIPGDQPFTWWG